MRSGVAETISGRHNAVLATEARMPQSLVRLAFAASVCVTPLRGADGQRPLLPVSPGDQVRLLTAPNGGGRFGKVIELDAERLALANCSRCSARIFPIDSIAALDVA